MAINNSKSWKKKGMSIENTRIYATVLHKKLPPSMQSIISILNAEIIKVLN